MCEQKKLKITIANLGGEGALWLKLWGGGHLGQNWGGHFGQQIFFYFQNRDASEDNILSNSKDNAITKFVILYLFNS